MTFFSCSHCRRSDFLFGFQLGQFFVNRFESLFGGGVFFSCDGDLLDFQLPDLAHQRVNLVGHRVNFEPELRGGFVNQVNRLVGHEAVGDVAVGKLRGGNQRGVGDAHAVMHFVLLFQTAQNRDHVLDGRLQDHDGLEAAFECGVLLDVFAIFVNRGGTDGVEFTASERGLQQVRRIHRAFGFACADQLVHFVNEQDDGAFRARHLFQHGFQTLFKFAAILRARDQAAQVERDDALVLEILGHVSGDDALRESFGDGGLPHSGFADQHGVVFRAARQHLQDAADFVVAANHGIEFAAAREVGQVAAVFVERAVFVFGRLIFDALPAAQVFHRFQDVGVRDARLA